MVEDFSKQEIDSNGCKNEQLSAKAGHITECSKQATPAAEFQMTNDSPGEPVMSKRQEWRATRGLDVPVK